MRLYGKRATEEQITEEIFNLLHGNDQRPYPLSVAEIAKITNSFFSLESVTLKADTTNFYQI